MRITAILLTFFMIFTAVLAVYTLNGITPLDIFPSKEQGYRTVRQQQRHDDVYCLTVVAEETAENTSSKKPAESSSHGVDGHTQTEEEQNTRLLAIAGQIIGLGRGKDTEIGLYI